MIEHDIETISNLCQRVAVLNFGQLIADGAPDAVFRDPGRHRKLHGSRACLSCSMCAPAMAPSMCCGMCR
jgi:energy-coupling factor transporter ATP-binding protein EcfA2